MNGLSNDHINDQSRDNKESNFISAVVYIHNREEDITEFLQTVDACLSNKFKDYEIICVDDASADASEERVKQFVLGRRSSSITLVKMGFFQGLESAMNAGVNLAIGDYIFEFDHTVIDWEPRLLYEVYLHSLKGYDIVAASNTAVQAQSRLFYRLYNRHAASQYRLTTETFRILSRRAVNRIHSMYISIPYRKALYANCGLKNDTVYYTPVKTAQKQYTALQKHNRLDLAINSLILFSDIAWKCTLTLSLLFMIATLGSGIYAVAVWLIGHPVSGYTTTMLLVSGGLFGVFAILSVVIKYLSVLVDLVFRKQNYLVSSVEKF
jgi:dolichol-phosphate mannosyltransferase